MPSGVDGLAHFLPGSRLSVRTVSDAMERLYAVFLRLGVNLSSMFDSRMPARGERVPTAQKAERKR